MGRVEGGYRGGPACHRAFPIRVGRNEGREDWWIPRGSQVRSLFPVNPPIVFQGTRAGYCVTGGGCYAAANKHEFAEFRCCTRPIGRGAHCVHTIIPRLVEEWRRILKTLLSLLFQFSFFFSSFFLFYGKIFTGFIVTIVLSLWWIGVSFFALVGILFFYSIVKFCELVRVSIC